MQIHSLFTVLITQLSYKPLLFSRIVRSRTIDATGSEQFQHLELRLEFIALRITSVLTIRVRAEVRVVIVLRNAPLVL